MYKFTPSGVCAKEITFDIDNGIIKTVAFSSGCSGNLQGISRLVEGMPIQEVIKRLQGISCGGKGTSCPDQFAKALANLEVK
ncbi:hypothetical protein SDC9_50719 [bioreactor metagenome]|uniref:ribonucleoside-diphosphate reductase n=1 Tax=bioreactor metagenome TaxID=1076179 RepID=A0A644WKX5_9ZZZZ